MKLARVVLAVLSLKVGLSPATCEGLTSLTAPYTVITSASIVDAGAWRSPKGTGQTLWVGDPRADPSQLPAFCRVTFTLKPSADSLIKAELWLPRAVERKVHGGGIYNNLAAYYATWYHKFSKTPTWPTVLPKPLSADVKEALTSFNIPMMKERDWYQYERKVPNVNNPIGVNLLETGANGAVFKQDFENAVLCPFLRHRQLPGKADRQHNYLSIRNKFFDDYKGQRTGYKTRYTEHLFGWDTGWAARSCFVPNCVTSALTTPRPTKTA